MVNKFAQKLTKIVLALCPLEVTSYRDCSSFATWQRSKR